jgi:hypothetical protein
MYEQAEITRYLLNTLDLSGISLFHDFRCAPLNTGSGISEVLL